MQNKEDLIYSYLINTKFYGNLRNKLSGTLSGQELKQLINGIQAIVRYKCESILCQFDQPVIIIIIYGEVQVSLQANAQINGVQNQLGKVSKKIYTKGQHFRVQKDLRSIPMTFLKATTLVLLNSEVLDHRISQIITIRQKIKLMQKCMPIKQLKLTLSELRKIAKLCQLKQVKGKYQKLQGKPGVYIFYQGIFQVCNRDNSQTQNIHAFAQKQKQNSVSKDINPQINNDKEISINEKKEESPPNLFRNTKNNHFYESPFLEMQNNFIEITQQLQFGIRLKTLGGKYGYIGRKQFYSVLQPDAVIQMQKCWKNKLQLRDYYNSKKQYILQSQKLREKIKLKLRKVKKMSKDEREKHDSFFYNQSLQLSRKTMLQKCSVYTARQFSVKSSRKAPQTPTLKKAKSLTATNWTYQKQKEENKPNQMVNQHDNISERLTKMRLHSDKKAQSRVKFEKQWYYLDENKMSDSLNMSYYKIKKQETKAQNVRQMCNYKRVHRIYSDPCFKKLLSFRNCWFY